MFPDGGSYRPALGESKRDDGNNSVAKLDDAVTEELQVRKLSIAPPQI
jgi:hypothetical protein